MFDTLYQYLFSSDITVYTIDPEKKTQILLRVGDRTSIFSSRHQQWFDEFREQLGICARHSHVRQRADFMTL